MFLLRLSKVGKDLICSWCFPVSHGSLSEQSLLLALPCLVSSEFNPGWARRMWQRFLCLWSHGSSLLMGRLACEYMPPFENSCQRSQKYKTVLNCKTCTSISCPGLWFTGSWHSSFSTQSLLKGCQLWRSACTHQACISGPRLEQSRYKVRVHHMPMVWCVFSLEGKLSRAWTVTRHHHRWKGCSWIMQNQFKNNC